MFCPELLPDEEVLEEVVSEEVLSDEVASEEVPSDGISSAPEDAPLETSAGMEVLICSSLESLTTELTNSSFF